MVPSSIFTDSSGLNTPFSYFAAIVIRDRLALSRSALSDHIGRAVLARQIRVGSVVSHEAALDGVHREALFRAITGVGEMAEIRAHHADGDVGIQVLVAARAAGGEEVRHVPPGVTALILLHVHR